MTTARPDGIDPRQEDVSAKPVWTRPTMEMAEIGLVTQAGGAASADQDPNQTS